MFLNPIIFHSYEVINKAIKNPNVPTPPKRKKKKRQIFTALTRQKAYVRFYGVKNNWLNCKGEFLL